MRFCLDCVWLWQELPVRKSGSVWVSAWARAMLAQVMWDRLRLVSMVITGMRPMRARLTGITALIILTGEYLSAQVPGSMVSMAVKVTTVVAATTAAVVASMVLADIVAKADGIAVVADSRAAVSAAVTGLAVVADSTEAAIAVDSKAAASEAVTVLKAVADSTEAATSADSAAEVDRVAEADSMAVEADHTAVVTDNGHTSASSTYALTQTAGNPGCQPFFFSSSH